MSTMQLYLLLKLDAVIGFIGTIVFFGFVLGAAGGLLYLVTKGIYMCEADKDSKDARECLALSKLAKPFFLIVLPVTLFMYSIKIAIPSTKEMAVLLVVPKIVNSKSVQQIPQKILSLSEEWLEELRPKSVKEVEKTSDNTHKPK